MIVTNVDEIANGLNEGKNRDDELTMTAEMVMWITMAPVMERASQSDMIMAVVSRIID